MTPETKEQKHPRLNVKKLESKYFQYEVKNIKVYRCETLHSKCKGRRIWEFGEQTVIGKKKRKDGMV